ncbi:hypothetical protein B0H11DRAFT_1932516 [Mycena galericulata]|nr:hypothetical protein B0H11DRAFT_1932516 [Mycena galericulata]
MRARLLSGVPKEMLLELPILGVPCSVTMSRAGARRVNVFAVAAGTERACGLQQVVPADVGRHVRGSLLWLAHPLHPRTPRLVDASTPYTFSLCIRTYLRAAHETLHRIGTPTPTSSASSATHPERRSPARRDVRAAWDVEIHPRRSISRIDKPATPSAVPAAPHRLRSVHSQCTYTTPPTTSSPADDRCLLALPLRPVPFLGARLAAHLWDASLGLGVGEAAARLPTSPADKETAFAAEKTEANTEERERALNYFRVLGGRVGLLAVRVGRVLGGGELDADADVDEGMEGDGEVAQRNCAVSTKPQDAQALRCTLGSSEVFEDVLAEDARDHVADLLMGEQ